MSGGEFIEFDAETKAQAAEVLALRRRLLRAGIHHRAITLGACSHGWTAGCRVPMGRATQEAAVHGDSPMAALEALVIEVESMVARARRGGRRR